MGKNTMRTYATTNPCGESITYEHGREHCETTQHKMFQGGVMYCVCVVVYVNGEHQNILTYQRDLVLFGQPATTPRDLYM